MIRTLLAVCVSLVTLGLGYLWVHGIEVRTTPEAFVTRDDMPVFEIAGEKMNVRLAPTPAKWPNETATIYRAASFGIPVNVELQSKKGRVRFQIDGLSKQGDFLIPCTLPLECILILDAAQVAVPEQLVDAATEQLVPDGVASYEQFEKSVQQYPYTPSAERTTKITQGFKHIELCMKKARVRSLLGEPDHGKVNYGPKGSDMKWIGSSWTYHLAKRGESANMNDATIRIFFDRGDRAVWIVPAHIDDWKALGNYGAKCPSLPAGDAVPVRPIVQPVELKH